LQKLTENQNSRLELIQGVKFVEDQNQYIKILEFVGYVLEKWLTRGYYQALEKQAGKELVMMSDIIADSLTRIRNASMRKKESTSLLYSKIVESILKVMEAKGYIDSYKVDDTNPARKAINVFLKYDDRGNSVITELKRVSKPGRRVYKPAAEIKKFKNGYGTIIITTSKGVLSNDEAHTQNVGGEVLCTIW
jgi:small subunit ribosomal protein S8